MTEQNDILQDMTIEQFRATLFGRLRELPIDYLHKQHQVLLEMIVDLYGCVRQLQRHRPTEAEQTTLARVLDQLKQYALRHFKEEEDLMLRMGFPGRESHIRAHQRFVAALLAVEERIWRESVAYVIDLLHLVVGWLFEHINQVDTLYARAYQGEVIDPRRFADADGTSPVSPAQVVRSGIPESGWGVPGTVGQASPISDVRCVSPANSQQKFRQNLESRLTTVGVARFDREHRQLLDQIITLHELVEELRQRSPVENDWQRLEQLLGFLGTYTTVHFKAEEDLMLQYQFPLYEQHRLEHQALLKRFGALSATIRRDVRSISHTIDLLFFLTEWFFNHTSRTDTQYRDFFLSKGVR